MSLLRAARNIRRPSPFTACRRALSSGTEEPIRTALYDLHVQLGGKIVPFAGYALPVQYKDGVVDSHNWVRTHAGLFDVSHMGQLKFTGTDVDKFIETITVVDLKNLKPHSASLSVITNESGGIIDDCIVTKGDNYISMVVNGACKHKDMDHMRQIIKSKFPGVKLDYFQDRSLIALQGPSAAQVLKQAIGNAVDVDQWAFMTDKLGVKVFGIPCNINRCGYTGEDGFEISAPSDKMTELTKKLLENPEVKPTGLAVRDSLRLEAGLCLYGHDLDEKTNPVEAALMWTISERRRKEGGFIGYEPIMNAFKNGVSRKRVGMIVQGAPAREGAPIQTPDGKEVGVVTSGSFSPILKKAISMGYVQTAFSKSATKLQAVTRGKAAPAEVTKLPFVPTRYFKVAPKA